MIFVLKIIRDIGIYLIRLLTITIFGYVPSSAVPPKRERSEIERLTLPEFRVHGRLGSLFGASTFDRVIVTLLK